MAAIIETQNLTHRYGKLTALNQVSLSVQQGEIYGFVGPNGAGKTTTMRILATLLRPTSGDAWIGGCSVRTDPRGVRRQIGYMPDFFGTYDEMKVREYLDFFAACYNLPAPRRRQLVEDLLKLVDLEHRQDDYVDGLSRGMKQRLCLARTLVHDPPVLILDEPASGLDPRARIEIRELLRELQSMGKTILFSSHILLEVAEICSRVGIVEAGALVAQGTMSEIRATVQQRHDTRCVQVSLSDYAPDVLPVLQAIPSVLDVSMSEDKHITRRGVQVMVNFVGDDLTQTQILTQLIEAGLPITGYSEVEIELEDVFMQITKGIVS